MCNMKVIVFWSAVLCFLHTIVAEETRLLDLDPNDAQQVIESQDQTLKYAPKIETNVPAVRFLGNEPHHVLEDIYLAKQYHGQDGLGGYLYGYSVPDIAKNEKKQAGGDLRGAYNYINGDGQEIKVEYWDDGTGFHQIDNVPKILPKQIEDSPEVKAAKDKFLKRWHEEAERNQHPIANPYDSHGNYASGPLSPQGQIQRQQQFAQQYPLGQSNQYPHTQPQYRQGQYQQTGQYQPSGQYSQNVPSFAQNPGSQQASTYGQNQNSGAYNQPAGQYQQPDQPQQSYGQNAGSAQFGQSSGQYQQNQPGQYQQSVGQSSSSSSSQYVPNQASGRYQPGQSSGQYQQNGGQYQQGQYQPQQNKYQSGQNQIDYSGQSSENSGIYAKPVGKNTDEEEETTGPPKGFFYSFDYPVGIIVQKQGKANLQDVYSANKANFESQLQNGSSGSASSANGYLYQKS